MKNLIKHFKSGSKLVPWYMVVLYLIFIGSDIYTTYITTPDLKYETNLIIRYFHLNYTHMIILSYTYACFGIASLFISRGYLDHFFGDNQPQYTSVINLIFHSKELFFSYIFMGFFYYHFFCSVYCTVNNYMGHVYLFKPDSPLFAMAKTYIEHMHIGVPYYYIYSQVTVAIIGYIFTALKIKRLGSEGTVTSKQELLVSN
jgi:hypothetical protein